MSIVRWSSHPEHESDVYMFVTMQERFECHACFLEPKGTKLLATALDALEHLQHHRDAGQKVPDYAFRNVEAEIRLATKPEAE